MKQHRHAYELLALAAAAYIIFIVRFSTNPLHPLLATIVFGFFYVSWGIFHHLHHHTLHFKVVLEYALVAILGVIIISTLLI